MAIPTFTEGQRVYHRGRSQFGIYVEDSSLSGESYVDFGADQELPSGLVDIRVSRVTTAQLVPADEVEENA